MNGFFTKGGQQKILIAVADDCAVRFFLLSTLLLLRFTTIYSA